MLLRTYFQYGPHFGPQYGSSHRKTRPDPLWVSTLIFVIGVVITAAVQALA